MSRKRKAPKWICPEARICVVAVASVALFFIQSPWGFLALGAGAFILLCICGAFEAGIRRLFVVGLLFLMQILMSEQIQSSFWIIMSTVFYVLTRFSLIALLGALITKTMTVRELIAGLRGLHMPETVVLPVSVMLRFFPTIKQEFGSIRDCMKIRGIDTSMKSMMVHPFLSMEYVFVPLLMRSTKIADELTMSATVRGIERRWNSEKQL